MLKNHRFNSSARPYCRLLPWPTGMHETAIVAIAARLFGPTCRWYVPNGFAKRPVSQCDSAHFTTQNGPFYSAKWAVLQHTMYQCVTKVNFSCRINMSFFMTHPLCLSVHSGASGSRHGAFHAHGKPWPRHAASHRAMPVEPSRTAGRERCAYDGKINGVFFRKVRILS